MDLKSIGGILIGSIPIRSTTGILLLYALFSGKAEQTLDGGTDHTNIAGSYNSSTTVFDTVRNGAEPLPAAKR